MRQFKPGQLQTGSIYPITASHAVTASYTQNALSASYAISASYEINYETSSSYAETASIALTASYALNFDTGSLTTTASFNAFTASYTTGSFTGSFIGSFIGDLNGTSSYALNAESASYALTASYAANVPLTASYALNAESASYSSTASYVETAQTASYVETAQTASYVTLAQTASYVETAQTASYYDETDPVFTAVSGTFVLTSSFDQFTSSYNTGSFTGSFYGDGSNLTGIVSSKWTGSNPISRDGNVEITGSLTVNDGITGSLYGTASWAENSITASYILQAESASYALTASWAENAQTASYVLQAVSASYSSTSSFATSALTASYVLPLNQEVQLTGSLNISGSTTQIGTNNLLGQTNLSGSIYVSGSMNALADLTLAGTLRLDPAQDPGNTNATASFLFTSASNTEQGYDLYYRQDGNLVKFKWIEGGISSGLLYGGVISASGATIFVSSGSGILLDPNASFSKEINPIFTYVTWPNYSAPATYLTSSQNTYIYIDAAGTIHQQTEFFDQTQYEQAIPLGRVTHPNYATITGIGSNVQTTYDSDNQQSAFIRAFGPIKIDGFSINAHPGTLGFGIGSGVAYTLGGFYSQDPNSPSHYHGNAFATSSIARAYRSGSGVRLDNNGGAFYSTVDPDYWDDGTGVLNTMASGDWQIQRVFANPVTGRVVVYYGQNTYTTLINALQYLATDSFTEGEFTAHSLIFVGYLVLKGQTNNLTDTNDNRIINAGIFRNIAGGSSGGGAVAQTLNDLSDVTITTPSNGQSLIYNSGTWENGTPSLASTASYLAGYTLRSSNNTISLNWDTRILTDGTVNSLDWSNRTLIDTSTVQSVDWGNRLLKNNTSTTVLDWQNATFTGSVQGTASYALTASYLDNYIPPFPYTGSAAISGSLTITGSLNVSGAAHLNTIRDYYNTTGSNGQLMTSDGKFTKWLTLKDSLQLQINSEGPTVTSGSKAYRYVDDEHYITKITIKSAYTGSIQFILRDSTTIYGSSSLSNGVLYTDTVLTGWTRTIPSGSLLEFVVGTTGGISSGSASTFLFLVNTLRKLT